jgi:hypothetical protein
MNITIYAQPPIDDPQRISWKANWTENQGTVHTAITYTNMFVTVMGNSSLNLSEYSHSLSIQHGRNESFDFNVIAEGSVVLEGVQINLSSSGNISSDWVSISPDSMPSIPAGTEDTATVTVAVPIQTAPGNYSGIINVTSTSGGHRELKISLEVPVNTSWMLDPDDALSYNESYTLDTAAVIGGYTVYNLGNVNQTFSISYSPWGQTIYTDFGTDLFEEDFLVNSTMMNPTNISVAKGGNSSFSIYQKGDDTTRENVGISINVSNRTGVPYSAVTNATFDIEEQPPEITAIMFFVDGVNTTVAELNNNVSIKVMATDDIGLNISKCDINITWPLGSASMTVPNNGELQQQGAYYLAANYSGNHSPANATYYNVTGTVYDEGGKSRTSGVYAFTAYANTTLTLDGNVTGENVTDVDLTHKHEFFVNYTINNTGLVYAYSPTLTFNVDSQISLSPSSHVFSNQSSGSVSSYVSKANVSELTSPGLYTLNSTLTYTNPDYTQRNVSYAFVVNVSSNKSMQFSPASVAMHVMSGSSNSSVVIINNTGNDALSSVDLTCSAGTACSGLLVPASSWYGWQFFSCC